MKDCPAPKAKRLVDYKESGYWELVELVTIKCRIQFPLFYGNLPHSSKAWIGLNANARDGCDVHVCVQKHHSCCVAVAGRATEVSPQARRRLDPNRHHLSG